MMTMTMTIGTLMSSAVQDEGGTSQTIQQFIESGGEMMVPLGICSVLVVAFAMERFLALRKARICPARIRKMVGAIQEGRFDEVKEALGKDKSPGGRVLAAGSRRIGFSLRDVEGAMEDQAHKELERMRGNVRPLVVVGAIAPLLGLLGTVLGIAESFRRVSQAGMGKPEVLASGIEMALTTTIVGLAIAIPAVVLSSFLQGRVRKLVLKMDEVVSPAVEHFAQRPAPVEGETHAA